ncbi:MAG: hypothetical protein NDJ89_16465 [Oligoflexia bacterium]|nr:hypothetical protein [Oligoflexia bacterium]
MPSLPALGPRLPSFSRVWPTLAAAALAFSPGARANIGETYGFGSRSSALAGASAAAGFNGFAAYANPAGLALVAPAGRSLALDVGFLYMDPSFLPIENVTITNDYIGDTLTQGNVDTSYRATVGQSLGAAFKLTDRFNLTAGLVSFLPFNQIAFLDTGETYHPEYVLYRARTQRPQVEAALGASLLPTLHVGAGFHLGFSLTNSATVFLSTLSNKPSSMRFTASMKAKTSPYLGVLWTPSPQFSAGSVVRFPLTSGNSMALKTAARAGGLGSFDFNFLASAALFYDPLSIETGLSYEPAPGLRTSLQLDFQAWRDYEFPALRLERCSESDPSCGVPITSSLNPGFPLRNLLIPRIAEEITLGATTLRAGYAYRRGIFEASPSGAGNYLDPTRHQFSLGAGHRFSQLQIDLHLAYHSLMTEHVAKSAGDEAGNGFGDRKIGAPGYDAGGKILGGGVSVSWLF